MAFNWSWNGILKQAAQQGMEGYKPGTPQAPQGYVPYEATLNQRGLSNNMQPDNSVIPGTTYQPDNFGNRQPQAVTQMEAVQQAPMNAEREERIASLTSQIKELEDRIASNEAKLKGWTGPANEIAALEAEKINTADPTSIWRWKADKDESRRIAMAEKLKGIDQAQTNAMYEITNTLSAIRPNAAMDSGTQQRYFQQLADLKTLAQKNGLPTDAIDAKIREVEGETETSKAKSPEGTEYEGTSREQWDNEAEELLDKPNLTQGDIMKFKQKNPNISNEVRQKLEAKHSELIEIDKKKTYEKKWNSYLANYEKEHGKVSDAFAKTLRRIYDKKNKKS